VPSHTGAGRLLAGDEQCLPPAVRHHRCCLRREGAGLPHARSSSAAVVSKLLSIARRLSVVRECGSAGSAGCVVPSRLEQQSVDRFAGGCCCAGREHG